MEYQEDGYEMWDKRLDEMAKLHAKDYFKDFVEGGIRYISYISAMGKIDTVYMITKVQTILMHSGIIIDPYFEKEGRSWRVSFNLYDNEEYCESSESESEVESEVESESEEDPQAICGEAN